MPQGKYRLSEISGPSGTGQYKIGEIHSEQVPTTAIDNRTWQDVMQDQAASVVRGAIGKDLAEHPIETLKRMGAFLNQDRTANIWGDIKDLAGAVMAPISGISGAAKAAGATLRTVGNILAPDAIAAPSSEEWQQAAEGAGSAAAAVPVLASGIPVVASGIRLGKPIAASAALKFSPSPEKLLQWASTNRANMKAVTVPTTTPAALLNAAINVTRPPRAIMEEWLAKKLSGVGPQVPPPYREIVPLSKPEVSFPNAPPPELSPLWSPVKPSGGPMPEVSFTMPELAPMSVEPNLKAIEKAIAPVGAKAQWSTLRNVPKLVKVVPELAGLPKGPRFDTALVHAFRDAEQQVIQIEDLVPRETIVPKKPIVQEWKALAKEYNAFGEQNTASTIEQLIGKWNKLPTNIPWETFRDWKRGFFKEGSITSVPMRRAYGALMESSSKISKELADANSAYSTIHRAIDDAKIDILTGRRIRTVGKTPTATISERMEENVP